MREKQSFRVPEIHERVCGSQHLIIRTYALEIGRSRGAAARGKRLGGYRGRKSLRQLRCQRDTRGGTGEGAIPN